MKKNTDNMNKNLTIIHHSKDLDGLSSGHSIRFLLESQHKDLRVEMVGWDYEDSIKIIEDELDMAEKIGSKIFITDISFPTEVMHRAKKLGAVWIDHHASAIENAQENQYSDMLGLRVDGVAACELVWKYFKKDVPKPITLLSKYDTFRKEDDWEKVLEFQQVMHDLAFDKKEITKSDWDQVFTLGDEYIDSLCGLGKKILKKKTKTLKDELITARVVEFEGLNFISKLGKGGSENFDSLEDAQAFDGMMIYSYCDENRVWRVSLRGFDHSPDLSKIARDYGGGGHKKACGFTLNQEQMTKVLEIKSPKKDKKRGLFNFLAEK